MSYKKKGQERLEKMSNIMNKKPEFQNRAEKRFAYATAKTDAHRKANAVTKKYTKVFNESTVLQQAECYETVFTRTVYKMNKALQPKKTNLLKNITLPQGFKESLVAATRKVTGKE